MRLTYDWNVEQVDDGCIVSLSVHGKRKSMVFHTWPQVIWAGLRKWYQGAFVQDAFPTLSADEREFLMTGITPEEWETMFREEDDKELQEIFR